MPSRSLEDTMHCDVSVCHMPSRSVEDAMHCEIEQCIDALRSLFMVRSGTRFDAASLRSICRHGLTGLACPNSSTAYPRWLVDCFVTSILSVLLYCQSCQSVLSGRQVTDNTHGCRHCMATSHRRCARRRWRASATARRGSWSPPTWRRGASTCPRSTWSSITSCPGCASPLPSAIPRLWE